MVVGNAQTAGRPLVLVWTPGLRICRPRPRLANRSAHRSAALAVPDRPQRDSCDETEGYGQVARDFVFPVDDGHRALLQPRSFLGNEIAHLGGRVLALVGGSPLGGRLF